tara:strand:- start:580 stop:1827 length:1248 start_codon:yes stop_codon:yes gene_type:complete
MRAIYLNAGPMVHFDGRHEEPIHSKGKAIVTNGEFIEAIADSESVIAEYNLPSRLENFQNKDVAVYDLRHQAIVPGLIDAHTHLLWSGDRSREVAWRHEGKSYADIASLGGGIQYTVSQTSNASTEVLYKLGYQRLRDALRTGTTHLEAKSGYGLSTESELMLLQTMDELGKVNHLPSLDPTWMGAHDVPKGTSMDAYVESILSDQLPAVVEQGIARSADVFCEPGWFSLEHTEAILKASRSSGLSLRMHIDEFADGGGGALAADLRVETADHAAHTPMEVRLNLKERGVNTGFLPGTPYAMGHQWPDMSSISENEIPFTLGTDFNPNCHTLSLPFVCSLMVQRCGVHPLEALAAVTVRAAKITPHPTGKEHGVLATGAVANFNIVDGPNWESIALRPSSTPFSGTVLRGNYLSQ